MKNPFVYGKTVSGEQFCNRDKEVKELVAETINCQNIIMFSPRRYGKTSLIKRVIEKVKARGILTLKFMPVQYHRAFQVNLSKLLKK